MMDGDEPIFSPQDFLDYVAREKNVGIETFRIPQRMIMVYNRRHFDIVSKLIKGKPANWWWYKDRLNMHIGSYDNTKIAATMNFIGSPAAVMVLEEFIACGAKKIFEIGISGGIQPFLKPGDIIVATEAISDEGTTSQYSQQRQRTLSSPKLRRHITDALNKNHVCHQAGAVLTTDGVYRETRGKLKKFRRMGILAVNMETSALYAVAKYRDVEIASAFIISDLLTNSGWQPAFTEQKVLNNIGLLLRVTVQAISKA